MLKKNIMTCPVSLAGHRECACFTAAQSMTLADVFPSLDFSTMKV